MDGDVGQPGREALRLLELSKVRVSAHVRILEHVLGLALVAQQRAQHAKEALVVPPHDQLEEGCLAAPDAPHQLGVRESSHHLRQRLVHVHDHLQTPIRVRSR